MRLHHYLLSSTALLFMSHVAFANCNCADDYDDDSSYDYLFEGDFQLSLLLGIADVTHGDGTLQVDSTESDSLTQTNSNAWETFTGQFGVSYIMPLYWGEDAEEDKLETGMAWFDSITPQINVYLLGDTTLEGDVLRFGYKNEATYDMDFNSTRLMFDVAVDVFTVRDFSFFALGGLGIAWNSTSLNWVPNPGEDLTGFNLAETDSSGFAYEFGGGVNYEVLGDLDVSLQYLFTVLDNVSAQGADDFYDDIHTSDLDIHVQSILLGVRLTI
ncbi:MAG: hypothetical protein WC748_09300 [Legionellales bacterium]|jgi:opacity protein-like surface antigen